MVACSAGWRPWRPATSAAWATTALERAIHSYRNPSVSRWRRLRYALLHLFIDRMRGKTDVETFRKRLSEHVPAVRGLATDGDPTVRRAGYDAELRAWPTIEVPVAAAMNAIKGG